MKKIFLLWCFLSINVGILFSQTGTTTEVLFYNNTSNLVKIQCFPISMNMNAEGQYNLIALNRCNVSGKIFDYNNGLLYFENILHYAFYLPTYNDQADPPLRVGLNHDYTAGQGGAVGSVGPGIYKYVFNSYNTNAYDSIIIENDGKAARDISIYYRIYNGEYCLYYIINDDQGYEVRVDYDLPETYYIRLWDPYPTNTSYTYKREKVFTFSDEYETRNFKYNYGNLNLQNPYDIIPLDSRMNCDKNVITEHMTQNQYFPDSTSIIEFSSVEERQGVLTLNLDIEKNVITPTQFYTGSPAPYNYNPNHVVPAIRITDGATLKICPTTNSSTTFTMNQYTDDNTKGGQIEVDPDSFLQLAGASSVYNAHLVMNAQCLTTVKHDGWLAMGSNSVITINNYGNLTMESGSNFAGNESAIIQIYPHGIFCNKGAIINGKLTLKYIGGNHLLECDNILPDYFLNDSTEIILSEGATLDIGDNKTLYFQGPETMLQMDSNSTIKLGENSKIVFQNGARIKANYAKFTSTNSNSTWSGVFLNDFSKDTIKNCIIENAQNGITIRNKNNYSEISSLNPALTEITNNTFVNSTTNTSLLNAIYVLNSSDVLLKGNSIYSNHLVNAFNIGILLEYCSPVNINIIGNTINNSLNGINSIQGAPYIASNTITGQTGSSYGIFLDNSNATIEYNNVNNFDYSINGDYSSPNVLNNTFSNALTSNLNLRKNSVFILNSIISGSTSYTYGGRNSFNGSPSISFIEFSDESYPSLDKGYNKINSGSSDYLSGYIPSVMDGTLYATDNYWDGANFSSLKFNVPNGIVEYDPNFDGSSYPSSDGYILSSIGFGLYDSLFFKNLGDFSSSDLYIQALLKEKQGLYTQAIQNYKGIISLYKESEYAVLSLAKIFDCLQKMDLPVSKFVENNIYLNTLKTNNEYPLIVREIAEDFIIKGKAKLGNVTEAINDYQSIYNQNQNNSKGFHALLNKTCLEQTLPDTSGDGHSGTFRDNVAHKIALMNLINLKSQNNNQNNLTNNTLPFEYKLSNNYPNPFNPMTKINFSIPKSGFVSLKIYDITGREIQTLVNEVKQIGNYTVDFNGSMLSSGVYFYRIQSGDFVMTKRMVLIK